MSQEPLIDDYPNLCASLGKAGVDRIRNHQTDKLAVGGSRTRWVQNPHYAYLAGLKSMYCCCDTDDIISGIAALEQSGDKALSAPRLYTLMACNRRISTELIQAVMNVGPRMARQYMAAVRLAIFHLSRADVGDTWEIEDLIDNPWQQLQQEVTDAN